MLRKWIGQLELDVFVRSCIKRSGLSEERIKDTTLEVLAELLVKEERFQDAFVTMSAFLAYMRKVVIRRILKQLSSEEKQKLKEDFQPPTQTPEERYLRVEETISSFQILDFVMNEKVHAFKEKDELRQLLHILIKNPEQYIFIRQSGKNKGYLAFNMTALSNALKWKRHRLYLRLERIRTIFLHELHTRESQS